MKRKIIMDCDPGHDDAIALILAGAIDSPLEILAVTTVAGNQSVDKYDKRLERIGYYGTPRYSSSERCG
ncbi:nucleoside hydrolase [Staphylococcus aureus]|nr:nucleoside hydrolase [Staphylococcus aureus]